MKNKTIIVLAVLALVVAASFLWTSMPLRNMGGHGRMHSWMHGDPALLTGSPADPSESWTLAKGGQIYDKWWAATGANVPSVTHPSYPVSGKQTGPDTWRCKECHGWDYKGKDGRYGNGSHATGIVGIRGAAARDVNAIIKLLRDPTHRYTPDMISEKSLSLVAAFVSRGQHDTDSLIESESGEIKAGTGSSENQSEQGRGIFQTTCAVCHGFDGRRLNFGTRTEPSFVGSEAQANPWEVLHKIRNGHPGAEMISLRALSLSDAAAVLAYARALPAK